jgi:hypothetical protein
MFISSDNITSINSIETLVLPACHKGHARALGQSAYTSLQRASIAAANTPFGKHALYEILVFLPKCLLLKCLNDKA